MVSGAAENRLSSREMPQVGWSPERKPGLHSLPHWENCFLPQGLCTRHPCYQIHTPGIIFKMKYFTLKENQKFENIQTRWFRGTPSFVCFLLKSMQVIISRFLPSQISCCEHSDGHCPHVTRPSLPFSGGDTSFPGPLLTNPRAMSPRSSPTTLVLPLKYISQSVSLLGSHPRVQGPCPFCSSATSDQRVGHRLAHGRPQ